MRRTKGSIHSPFFFLVLCLLIFNGLAWPGLAQDKSDLIFIDPEDPSQIIRIQIPFNPQVVLKAQDLPRSSEAHPSVFLENEKFTFLVRSPGGQILAFCVDAGSHDWTGVVNLVTNEIRQVGLSYEAEAAHPSFSEDGRYLTLEENLSQARHGLEIFDLEKETACRLDGRQARDKFLNFSDLWWSPQGDRVYFKVEYNNSYRKSLGLRPKSLPKRIAEATPECGKIRYYSVAEFMEKHPGETDYSELALQKGKID